MMRWDVIVVGLLCLALGVGLGTALVAPASEAVADEGDAGADEVEFSAAVRQSMGIEIAALQPTRFSVPRSLSATLEPTVGTVQPLFAPCGGRVVAVTAESGAVVGAGTLLVTLLRAETPWPELRLTAEFAAPDHGEIHAAIAELRRANGEAALVAAELDRLGGFSDDDAVVPGQRLIELRQEEQRAALALELAAHELERHGFTHAQVRQLAAGEHRIPYSVEQVRRTLSHHGLWNADCDSLAAVLPEELRSLTLAVATVAELVAQRRHLGVAEWLAATPDAGAGFLAFAGALLGGRSLADVQAQHALGAWQPIVEVVAPDRAPNWDVGAVHVRPGQHLAHGAPLLELIDARRLQLRASGVGGEAGLLADAVRGRLVCRAVPVPASAGPVLERVVLETLGATAPDGVTVAFGAIDNAPLRAGGEGEGAPRRGWLLRAGMPFELRVPTEVMDDVYVLPRTAVIDSGENRLIYIPHGAGFEPLEVVVLYRDDAVAVVARGESSHLAPGEPVVVRGGYEIDLALRAGGAAVTPHHH